MGSVLPPWSKSFINYDEFYQVSKLFILFVNFQTRLCQVIIQNVLWQTMLCELFWISIEFKLQIYISFAEIKVRSNNRIKLAFKRHSQFNSEECTTLFRNTQTLKKQLLDNIQFTAPSNYTSHSMRLIPHTLSHTQRLSHPKFHFAMSDWYEHKSDCLSLRNHDCSIT